MGRTLNKNRTGRTPKVFSSSYIPPKAKARKELRLGPIFKVVVLAVIIFGVTRLPIFKVNSVSVQGTSNLDLTNDLNALKGSSIFSRKISSTIERWLREDGSIADLNCRKGLPSDLSCVVKPREPKLILKKNGQEYVLDGLGVVFATRAAEFNAPVLEDRAAQEVKLGEEILSEQVVDQIIKLDDILKEAEIIVDRYLVEDSLYQLGAVVTSFKAGDELLSKSIIVRFVSSESITSQTKTLQSLLKERGRSISERVDLRVPGYVYYK